MSAVDSVKPEDSVSQCDGSAASSTSSSRLRVKVMARRAALTAEAERLKQHQELELEQIRLKQKRIQLELQTKLEIAQAEEEIYNSLYDEKSSRVSRHSSRHHKEGTSHDSKVQPSVQQQQDDTLPYPLQDGQPAVTGNQIKSPQVMSAAVQQQQSLLEAISLQNVELMKFDGNPLHYFEFIKSFDSLIGRTSLDEGTKLLKLYNCCLGETRSIIQSCMVMDSSVAYKKARSLLQERFGNKFRIGEAWIRKVTSGPSLQVNDKKGLQKFADELQICRETLHALDMMTEMSTQQQLVKIIERLPHYLRSRWLRIVKDKRLQGRSPDLADVVHFVADAALEVNDPVYGGLLADKRKQPQPQGSRQSHPQSHGSRSYHQSHTSYPQPGVNFAGSDKKEAKCVLCHNAHVIFSCKQFKDMKPEERFQMAKDKHLCFNCLKPGHSSSRCFLNRTCSINGCNRKHSRFLHMKKKDTTTGADASNDSSQQSPSPDVNEVPSSSQNGFIDTTSDGNFGNATGAGKRCVLPIVPVRVQAATGGNVLRTFALLDTGSTNSFCTKSLTQKLNVTGRKQTLSLTTLDNAQCTMDTSVVSLIVDTGPMSDRVKLDNVFTKDKINIKSDHMATVDEMSEWTHLHGINLPFASGQEIGLLIGQDAPEALIPLEVRRTNRGPYAVRTLLGWSLHGPVSSKGDGTREVKASSSFIDSECPLETQLERFWKLESDSTEGRGMSVNDRKVISIWEEGKSMEGGHYQLPIPFKQRPPELPNNRWVAEQRLESLRRKLSKDDALFTKYKDGIADLLQKGYCEEVKEEDSLPEDAAQWYLPHHPVFHAMKPGKVRIVFDCASKFAGVSLNDVVHQGPDLTNKLIGVLLRFRQEPVAMMADIEAMFHQVRVPESDRDVLRFLWWPSGDMTAQPKIYRMCVHLFGGTWSPSCCSYALRQTAEDHRADYDPEVLNMVQHNFYVDDCLVSVDDEHRAIEIAAELATVVKEGGFRLTKWLSNRPTVLESIPQEERAKQAKGLDLNHDALPVDRALGLSWDIETDCFVYKTVPKEKPPTRRGLLSVVSSVYDPLGFISPYILKAKCILQELCRMKLRWDDPIPEPERQQWEDWLNDLPEMSNMSINRCIKPHDFGPVKDYQLHHFSDASEKAYGAVSYLMMVNAEGTVCCSLQMAKSRLAPLKKVTIPRLELMAATLASRLDGIIRQELDVLISKSTFWTDSTIVLRYVKNEDKRFQTFVANRVATIRNNSEPSQWHHVDTCLNPADDTSRGMTASEMISQERWLHGPEFLYRDESTWPEDVTDVNSDDDSDLEVKTKGKSFAVETNEIDYTSEFLSHYSSWYRMKRAVCWIQRFIKWLKCKSDPPETLKSRLTLDEMKEAEDKILSYEQKKAFQDEIDALNMTQSGDDAGKQKWKTVKKSSKIYKLDPRMEDGLLRVGGRLSRSSLPLEAKHPVILPKDSHVTRLILRELHEMSGHSGRNHVMSRLHQKYWITGASSLIRSLVGKCVTCRRQRGKVIEQQMADLPEDRIRPHEPPFTSVGMDYFGPITVKRGRSMVKRYGVLFTCLAIRAIHIEMAHSLDTDSCINAIRRFMARRGNVKEIRSDNGTNLVGAEKELRKEIRNWNQSQIHNVLLQKEVKWTFNPPCGSHHGGVWERMIRTVRKVLCSLTKQQTLTDESLQTLFCEVESIVNSRPITMVTYDVNDVEALTPNHMLLLNTKPQLPPTVTSDSDTYARRRWRQVQYLSDVFWSRWVKEYLPQLQARQRWVSPRRNIKVDDVVVLVDEHAPRNSWLLGRVLQTRPDRKGFVRQCEVKTRTGVFLRPVSKLCLILEGDP